MAKKVIDARKGFDSSSQETMSKSIWQKVLEGLISIIIPPERPKTRYVAKWYKSVETGRWVKVWKPERR